MAITLPFFGELDPLDLEDYYEIDTLLNENDVQIDLNFDESEIVADSLLIVKDYLENLPALVQLAKKSIDDDFKTGVDVAEFTSFHIEELDNDELEDLLENADKSLSKEEQILSVLKLIRVGFYPENEEEFVVFDFTIDEDISQYLLVVKMNNHKAIEEITMES
jgi:hypothetical protein